MRDVTIQNVGIYGNNYGVLEMGPDAENNAILNNDFCDNGTDIETYSSSTTASGNTYCEENGGSGAPISTGTYYVTNVNSGLLLEVADADTSDGANVLQWATAAATSAGTSTAVEGTTHTSTATPSVVGHCSGRLQLGSAVIVIFGFAPVRNCPLPPAVATEILLSRACYLE